MALAAALARRTRSVHSAAGRNPSPWISPGSVPVPRSDSTPTTRLTCTCGSSTDGSRPVTRAARTSARTCPLVRGSPSARAVAAAASRLARTPARTSRGRVATSWPVPSSRRRVVTLRSARARRWRPASASAAVVRHERRTASRSRWSPSPGSRGSRSESTTRRWAGSRWATSRATANARSSVSSPRASAARVSGRSSRRRRESRTRCSPAHGLASVASATSAPIDIARGGVRLPLVGTCSASATSAKAAVTATWAAAAAALIRSRASSWSRRSAGRPDGTRAARRSARSCRSAVRHASPTRSAPTAASFPSSIMRSTLGTGSDNGAGGEATLLMRLRQVERPQRHPDRTAPARTTRTRSP